MNGKRAKRLRKAALLICNNVLKIGGGEGKNEYNQAMNCTGWGNPKDKDGHPLLDGDGYPLMSIVHDRPGTVTTAWKWKIIYNSLKKEYKRKRMAHCGRPNTMAKKRTGSTDGRPAGEGVGDSQPVPQVPEGNVSGGKVETKV